MLGLSNQPAHHIPFFPMFTGRHDDAHRIVRESLERLFVGSDLGQGYPGDEDNGEMSAWYVFASIGLFPQTPGRAEMLIGSPTFSTVDIRRSSGERLVIRSSGTEPYVQGARLNGWTHERSWVPASFVTRGGTLSLRVGNSADTGWASGERGRPIDH